jgi:hypothetical protein
MEPSAIQNTEAYPKWPATAPAIAELTAMNRS